MTIRKILAKCVVALTLVGGITLGGSSAATAGTHSSTSAGLCSSRYYAAAQPKADTVTGIPIANNGWRSYSLGIGSYLQRCGGYVYASHRVYIDTRNLPRGHRVWIQVSTRRSDGVWARAHEAPILQVTGQQRVEEVILNQRRGVGGGLSLTQVKVVHTATTPGDGALIPRSSTLTGIYKPWYGPEAKPRS